MAVIVSCLVAPELAQTPGRTVTIAVPYSPRSGPDILARLIGDKLARRRGPPLRFIARVMVQALHAVLPSAPEGRIVML
jgi:tripartite-type tricarboxylate transporter receptor subunit TctC